MEGVEIDSTYRELLEVFERMTGTTIASRLRRTDAAAEARCRSQDSSGTPAEPADLHAVVDGYVPRTGSHSRLLVAQAVEALEEFRTEIAGEGGPIRDKQTRIATLSTPFNDRNGDHR